MKKLFAFLTCALLLLALCVGASAASNTVVYLKDGGTGNGSSPDAAVATLNDAYDMLDLEEDCTVVLCGPFTQSKSFSYGKDYTGSVTFTSVYDGVDYRKTAGATYQFNNMKFACHGDTRFENLNFTATGAYMYMFAQHYPVTVGKGVAMTGEKMVGGTIAKSFSIYGGYCKDFGTASTRDSSDINITVLSGSKFYIVPFSRSLMGDYTGTANITVGGSADVSVLHGSSTGATGISLGDVRIRITGDAKVRAFYGATGAVTVNSYVFNWSGGTINKFEWNCSSTPAANLTVTGKKVLYATEEVQKTSAFTKYVTLFDTVETLVEVVEEDPDALKNATVVYVKDGGTGNGASADAALMSLEDAYKALDLSKDCTVVICGAFTQTEPFAYGEDYDGSVTVTSVYDGVDYRKSGAAYTMEPTSFACYGDTRFENLDFKANGAYYYLVGQHNPVTVGEGVTVTGEKMTTGSVAKSFTIVGGYYKGIGDVKAEDSSEIHVTVLSGSKFYIIPFSRSAKGTYKGTAHITVGGNANVPVLHGSATGAAGIELGDVIFEISGDAKIRSIYGATSEVNVNSYELIWHSGSIGELEWNCAATSGADLTVHGTKLLRASDAAKGYANYAEIAALFDSAVGLDETVTVVEKTDAPAIRSDYGCARGLYLLGLAQGYDTTGTNFGIEDKMTRAQTVVQVIRFLGVEDAVKAGTYAHPFTDVPAWASNYVGYAYQNKITSGVSATKFNPDGETTEAQFLTFMLRAIGYSDANGDFVWSDPFALTKKIGMTATDKEGILFKRGDAFRFAWNTLYSTAKDGGLVKDDLIAKGLFTAAELEKAVADAKDAFVPTAPQSATVEGDYYVLPIEVYKDKTTAGFLGDVTGFMSGYEFVYWGDGTPRVAMPDEWFELMNGPYANPNPYNSHKDHLYYIEEKGIWEAWIDDDYSIDILDQYILRDMYDQYGTFTSKVITDDWVKYDVYDMGGGHRSVGAYGLMSKYGYLPEFAGSYEFGNYYSYCYEPCIGNETVGMSAAGMPLTAMQMASVFGSVTGDQENVTWLKFLATMYSLAYVESDIETLIREAQQILPADSYTSWVIDNCFALHAKYPDDWRAAAIEAEKTHLLHKNLMDTDITVDPNVNNSFLLLALLYGEGDFTETCKIISLSGYDGDSSGAIVMGLMGVIGGMDAMPAEVNTFLWQDGKGVIINDHQTEKEGYWMCMMNLPREIPMADIVALYQKNFESVLLENGGKIENGNYYIPRTALGKADSVYFENFNDGDLSAYKAVGGKAELMPEGYEGDYTAKLVASENGESSMYTTVGGLTVGEEYRVVCYVSTTGLTEAELFVREAGEDGVIAHVYDTAKHIRRSFTFTATAESMEFGIRLPEKGNAFTYATLDYVQICRVKETPAAALTLASGEYTGKIDLSVDGKADGEVLLKVTFANTTGATVRAGVTVNGDDFNTAPFYKTGAAVDANVIDATYIPVLLQKEQNTVTLDIGEKTLYIVSAEVVTVSDLW